MDHAQELAFAIELAKKAGTIHKKNIGQVAIEFKGREIVTQSDREADSFIRHEIAKSPFSAYGIISEEDAPVGSATPYTWVVDPLDGSTAFSRMLPLFTVSIALAKNNIPILGVVHNPLLGDTYFADDDGAFYTDIKQQQKQQLHTAAIENLAEADIEINGPQTVDQTFNVIDAFTHGVVRRVHVRRAACAEEVCFVAAGKSDATIFVQVHSWDFAAGIVIAKQAGACVQTFEGAEPNLLSTTLLVAATKPLAEQIRLRLMEKHVC